MSCNLEAMRAMVRELDARFNSASKAAQDAQERFYAAALARDRARAELRAAESDERKSA